MQNKTVKQRETLKKRPKQDIDSKKKRLSDKSEVLVCFIFPNSQQLIYQWLNHMKLNIKYSCLHS